MRNETYLHQVHVVMCVVPLEERQPHQEVIGGVREDQHVAQRAIASFWKVYDVVILEHFNPVIIVQEEERRERIPALNVDLTLIDEKLWATSLRDNVLQVSVEKRLRQE